MKKFVALVCVLAGSLAAAQEIGTEIPAETPPPPPPESSWEKPAAPQPSAPTAPSAQALVAGPRKGAFGLVFGIVGQGTPSAATTSSGTGSTVPTFGFKYLATDSVAILFDVGAGLAFGNNVAVGLGVDAGLQVYLGNAQRALRPFVLGQAGFAKTFDPEFENFHVGIDVGGGAEYWFSDAFSLSGRLLLSVPLEVGSNDLEFTVVTVVPGLLANFYF